MSENWFSEPQETRAAAMALYEYESLIPAVVFKTLGGQFRLCSLKVKLKSNGRAGDLIKWAGAEVKRMVNYELVAWCVVGIWKSHEGTKDV